MPKLKKPFVAPVPPAEPTIQRLLLSVSEAAIATDLSKSYLYLAMKAGTLRFVKAGARRLIAVSELEAFIARLPQGTEVA